MNYSTEESAHRFLSRLIHLCASFAPYIFLGLAFSYLNWLVPKAVIPALLIVVSLIEFSLLVMIVQFIFCRPKVWKHRPLILQVLYASKRLSLAEHNPVEWCWHLLRYKQASLLKHHLVWSVLPLIVTVTELRHVWYNMNQVSNKTHAVWTAIEYILDQQDRLSDSNNDKSALHG